ncbi:MAG: TadA family conjugal transfer-associated ATPase [Microbacteriaceae bacterium]
MFQNTALVDAQPVARGAFVARRQSPQITSRSGRSGGYPIEFGALAFLVADPRVTDIFVNGPGEVWIDRGSGLVRVRVNELNEADIRHLAVKLMALAGRHIDETTPCLDAQLHDGIRVHAVLPPISGRGTLLSIRLPRVERWGLSDLDTIGFFAPGQLAAVRSLVARRANTLISGAGGSGKTTLLSAMLGESLEGERIIAVEDVAELRVAHPQFITLQARQANLEGAGQVDLTRLVREALRMRPDRLVVGECRGPEIRDLFAALNTGHDGGAGTVHANSLADVPARLEALGALAGMSAEAVARQAVSAIGAVLHVERIEGVRRLASIGKLVLDSRDRLDIDSREEYGVPLEAREADE